MPRKLSVLGHQPSAIAHQTSKAGMSLLEVILAIAVALEKNGMSCLETGVGYMQK